MFLELCFSPRRLFKETKSIPAAGKVIQAAHTHWVSSYESPYLPVCSVSLSYGKNTWRSHAPIQACEHRQFFSLSGNVCHFSASLHRDGSLQRVKYLLVYYYWGFHSHKTYIQRRGCHEKNSNESPCKSDKRKYLTVKVINGAVKERPVKYISPHFSGELVMRPVTFSSSSNSEILPNHWLLS